MIENIPKTIPIEFGDHGNELLKLFEISRKKGIGTDVEIMVGSELLMG